MSDTPHLVPYPLVMQLPKGFIPQHIIMIAMDENAHVQVDGVGGPFTRPAMTCFMVSELLRALAHLLTVPTVAMPPDAPITHREGRA